jgi:hypothetical protein
MSKIDNRKKQSAKKGYLEKKIAWDRRRRVDQEKERDWKVEGWQIRLMSKAMWLSGKVW